MPMNMTDTIIETPADAPVILMRRRFGAPRELVFRCYTDPAHMAHFWGPRDATTKTTISALAPGGVWVTRWTYPDGKSWGYSSVYLEIAGPARIVYRDCPDGWPGGLDGLPPLSLHTVIALTEAERGTEVLVTVTCPSIAERDENVRRGFAGMVATGHDRLAEYLTELQES
jgi:uncharacterized protein YndB with AHSA1/START domain